MLMKCNLPLSEKGKTNAVLFSIKLIDYNAKGKKMIMCCVSREIF